MKDFVNFYLTEYEYYYDILDIRNKDIYELIKILLNIFKKNNSILKKYKKYYIKNKLDQYISEYDITFKCFSLDKKILNKVKAFLKNLNIDIIENNELIDLDISNALFFNKYDKTNSIQDNIIKYQKIKKNLNKDNIENKNTYLCRLKSECDDLIKNCTIKNDFLTLNTKKFKKYMQTLMSHKGGKYKIMKILKK